MKERVRAGLRCLRPERLARLVESPLSNGERRHLDGCAVCIRAAERVQVARAALRDMAEREPPEPSPASLVRAEASIRWTRVTPRSPGALRIRRRSRRSWRRAPSRRPRRPRRR